MTTDPRAARPFRWRGWMLGCLTLLVQSVPVLAQSPPGDATAPVAPTDAAGGASRPASERGEPTRLAPVEIRSGVVQDTELRRQSTAGKITIGRDEIERFGDSSVGDLLRRLPGVTLQGRPGRGGNIRMRGLGGGYTQILLDGERVPPGFSIESLNPEQIERIEIQRAPTAETGARAIAGTINIITREGFSQRHNDLRVTAGVENDSLQPGMSWTRNDVLGGIAYNHSISLTRSDRRNDSETTTEARDLATDTVTLAQRDSGKVHELRNSLHASGRLQWRGEAGRSAMLMPLFIYTQGETRRDGRLEQSVPATPPPYALAHSDGRGHFRLLRLGGQWAQRFDERHRLELRGGAGEARFAGNNLRQESGGATPHRLQDDTNNTERSANLSAKLSGLLGDGDHTVVGGAELEAVRRNEAKTTLQDGVALLGEFGDNLSARSNRIALYAQDEWSISDRWSAHAGLRFESIATQGSSAPADPVVDNTSRVWSPLMHLLWKPVPAGRDQLRASLTRSYRSPSLSSLIARPSINTRYQPPTPNTPTQADRAGNPNLRPELATGLDLAYEHYLPLGGLVSANVFQRRIRDYMRSVTSLETVSWSTTPRYVSRQQNVGNAVTRGLELEAKFRLSVVMPDAPALDVRTNVSVFRSRVDVVPGPDNRLDQQPDWTANLGADYRWPGTPLALGGSLGLTPGYTTRLSAEQSVSVNAKVVADAYGVWTVNPGFKVRLSASNLDPRNYVTGSTFDDAGVRESTQTVAPTYVNIQLRLEFRL
jgi:outer membrane receptor for ferrienterochelin and colicins